MPSEPPTVSSSAHQRRFTNKANATCYRQLRRPRSSTPTRAPALLIIAGDNSVGHGSRDDATGTRLRAKRYRFTEYLTAVYDSALVSEGGVINHGRMGRRGYYHDVAAPQARELSPAAFVVVRNGPGQVLLVRCTDDLNWELPGGRVDVRESASAAVVREVADEAGITNALAEPHRAYLD